LKLRKEVHHLVYVHVLVVAGCPSTKGYRAAEDGGPREVPARAAKENRKERKEKSRTIEEQQPAGQ
jgi:hypothetical protein